MTGAQLCVRLLAFTWLKSYEIVHGAPAQVLHDIAGLTCQLCSSEDEEREEGGVVTSIHKFPTYIINTSVDPLCMNYDLSDLS